MSHKLHLCWVINQRKHLRTWTNPACCWYISMISTDCNDRKETILVMEHVLMNCKHGGECLSRLLRGFSRHERTSTASFRGRALQAWRQKKTKRNQERMLPYGELQQYRVNVVVQSMPQRLPIARPTVNTKTGAVAASRNVNQALLPSSILSQAKRWNQN